MTTFKQHKPDTSTAAANMAAATTTFSRLIFKTFYRTTVAELVSPMKIFLKERCMYVTLHFRITIVAFCLRNNEYTELNKTLVQLSQLIVSHLA